MSSKSCIAPWSRIVTLAVVFLVAAPVAFSEIETDENGNLVEFTYATMSDGVKIALAVGYPKGFDSEDESKHWPTILQMSGYGRETRVADQAYYAGLYVTVSASLRGTGASGGKFSLFSDRSMRDGYEVIEDWIVKQPWSNGKVGIHGHSWTALNGFRVAAMNPPHLEAIVVSGMFDDAVRGLVLIGGIRNIGFPVRWSSNFERPDGVFGSDDAAIESRNLSEAEARALKESRSTNEEAPTPSRPKTLRELAGQIRAPIYLMHAYQDEQTGPSGAWLFDHIPEETPKRLVLSNGDHGMPLEFIPQRRAWFDYWLLGERSAALPNIEDPHTRVHAYFEVERQKEKNAPVASSDFPLSETQWTHYYLDADEALSLSVPASGADAYTVKEGAADDTLDRLDYRVRFEEAMAICGPMTVTLWAESTVKDADLFVVISDIAPDGREWPLQRGMLRASLRALDEDMSTWIDIDGERTLVRPYHDFQKVQAMEPGEIQRLDIEVFPVGHVFRAGHQLAVTIGQPPVDDPVPYPKKRNEYKSGSYKYESDLPAGTVTIHRSKDYPSSILVPVLPEAADVANPIPESIDIFWNSL